ncbi:MAG: prepilin peptidase, partial [Acidobacteria bacterium]|nr:prepilin peptidase [Acidobacteriota bacterium]
MLKCLLGDTPVSSFSAAMGDSLSPLDPLLFSAFSIQHSAFLSAFSIQHSAFLTAQHSPLNLVFAFVFGAIIGSFLNVVIHRWPAEMSIVTPASHCPNCLQPIRWWDNIPVISWLVLRASCRNCQEPISPRYPLVELSNALFYVAIAAHTGLSVAFLPVAAIASMLIVLIFIDLDTQLLPDVVDIPGIFIGLLIGWLGLGGLYPLLLSSSLIDSVIGAVAGGGLLLLVGFSYKILRKVEGMGLGDVKMLAMIGAVTGWQGIVPVLFVASLTGAIVGIVFGLRQGSGLRLALPFGPFLGVAALFALVLRLARDSDQAVAAVRAIGTGGIVLATATMLLWQVAPIMVAARFGTPDAAGVWARAQLLKYVPVPAS